MAVKIREAKHDDIPELVAMGRAMHEESPEYQRMDFSEEKVAKLARYLCGTMLVPSRPGSALVAEDEGRIIGMMAGFVIEHFFGHDKIASEYVLYVKPEHRRGTAAVRLIRAFEKWALSQGVRAIMPGVTTGNKTERTQALYMHLGYEANGVTLIKRVK